MTTVKSADSPPCEPVLFLPFSTSQRPSTVRTLASVSSPRACLVGLPATSQSHLSQCPSFPALPLFLLGSRMLHPETAMPQSLGFSITFSVSRPHFPFIPTPALPCLILPASIPHQGHTGSNKPMNVPLPADSKLREQHSG